MILYSHLIARVQNLENSSVSNLSLDIKGLLKELLSAIKNQSINTEITDFFKDKAQVLMFTTTSEQKITPKLAKLIDRISEVKIKEKYMNILREINEIIPDVAVILENDGSSNSKLVTNVQMKLSQLENLL